MRSVWWQVCRFVYVFFSPKDWNIYLQGVPLFLLYVYFACKARTLFYFSRVNPAIWFSGLLAESKWEVYKLLPVHHIPFTYLLPVETSTLDVLDVMKQQGISYPIVLKPDVGERGRRVCRIRNDQALTFYLAGNKEKLILQSYVDYPLEVGIFYYRFPTASSGGISSITIKQPMCIQGDGTSTVKELMQKSFSARRHIAEQMRLDPTSLDFIPPKGVSWLVSDVGNAARGASFLDGRKYLTAELTAYFDTLAKRMPGFYYGRFDIRCASFADLAKGKNFKILELNGVGAEPTHILDPACGVLQSYKDRFYHIRIMYKIACMNQELGVPLPSLREQIAFLCKKVTRF